MPFNNKIFFSFRFRRLFFRFYIVPVKIKRVFRRAFQCFVVYVYQPETTSIPFQPFEIIQNTPHKVAADINVFSLQFFHFGKMSFEEIYTIRIVNFSVYGNPIGASRTVFQNIHRLFVSLGKEFRSPIQPFTIDVGPDHAYRHAGRSCRNFAVFFNSDNRYMY